MEPANVIGNADRAASARAPEFLLFAHRGGVVEDRFPDNSMASLQAALDRSYGGLEVDVRESRDGHAVMRHDRDLRAHYRDERNVDQLTWPELQCLRSPDGQHRLLTLEESLAACKNKVALIVDVKPPHSPAFPAVVEDILRREGILENTCIIGTPAARRHFAGKARVGYAYVKLLARLATERHARQRYFLFDEGRKLNDRRVRLLKALQVRIIASVNVFHYEENPLIARKPANERGAGVWAAAGAEISRLKAHGVREFQIDSEFDSWFDRA